mmetsp:Transcript_56624/g.143373  ORF Transcript_56624/g.143373 Transcript_56624/m.143373 type:complete len:439 (-) Transcript_56624:55-1371(-)
MAMFAASLNTLKKRASELVKETVKEYDPTKKKGESGVQINELGPPSYETQEAFRQLAVDSSRGGGGGLSDGPMVVRYEITNGDEADREGAAFPLPVSPTGASVGHLRRHFPVRGTFHFRFKSPTPDGCFGGFIWVDLGSDAETLPIFRGEICMKALRLPDSADPLRVLEPLPCGSILAAAASAAAASGSPIGTPPQRERRPSPTGHAGGYPSSPGLAEQGVVFEQPPPRVEQQSPTRTFEAPASASPPRAPKPPDDLMDLGNALDSPAQPARPGMPSGIPAARPSPTPTPTPPPQPVVLDREKLKREREAKEQQRVKDAAAKLAEETKKEAQLKADKVESSNKIGADMDRWAKTPDGQSYKDIKVLISTMHTVMWPDSGWKELPLSELVSGPGAVKKHYRRAILVVHPDKQKNASPEQQVRADRAFQALNEAFKVMET